jgi:hypothetical protein
MPRKQTQPPPLNSEWLARISGPHPLGGIPGPGRWLVFSYEPTALFSLKMSRATSSVGRTLLIPTPYAVKMAFVDAAFRTGWQGDIAALIPALAAVDLRIGVPDAATVTHTIVKVRQEPKESKAGVAYIPAVAYREFVHLRGPLKWAFDLAALPEWMVAALIEIAPLINYVGKRGSFIQFMGASREVELGARFTQPFHNGELRVAPALHIATLDDFGPEANLEALNSFSSARILREKHRVFRETLVPLGLVNVGPGFSEYAFGPE